MRSDEELVEKTLSGDKSAFCILVERYQAAAYGLAFHLLKNFVDAQDAAQEALIRAYCNLPSLREPTKFASWLNGIVRHVCQSWHRREKEILPLEQMKESELKSPESTPEEKLERRALWNKVMKAIDSLSEKNKIVLTLCYIDGLAYNEIANFLDIPTNTVRDRLYRARGMLKEKMLQIVEEEFPRHRLTPSFKAEVSMAIEELRSIALLALKTEEGSSDDFTNILNVAVEEYGGEMYAGEEGLLSAIFGVRTSHGDAPERAILSALEVRDALAESGRDTKFRASITTGMAEVRGDKFALVGDTLKSASDLIDAAHDGMVLVCQTSYRLSKGRFMFSEFTEGDMQVHEVLNRSEHPRRLWDMDGFASSMIGRNGEYTKLKAYVDRLLEGEGSIVSIIGVAGIGKSRMASEMRKYTAEKGILWLEGRCISYGQRMIYTPFLEVIREYFGISMTDSYDDMKRKMEAMSPVPSHVPDGQSERKRRGDVQETVMIPYLLNLLTGVEPEELKGLTAEQLRYRTFIAVRTLLRYAAEEDPLMVVIEDLHWIDEASYELLTFLMASAGEFPILFLCIYRPERDQLCWQFRKQASTKYSEHYQEVALFRLPSYDSKTLLNELLKWELPATVEERILKKSGGNPLFLGEIARVLVNSGKLVRIEDGWEFSGDVDEIEVPDTVFSVINSRINGLGDGAKHVLRCASVIGDIFPRELLESVSEDVDEGDIRSLGELEFLVEGRLKREYTFKHVLIKDVAYSSILPETRSRLHKKTAESIERLYSNRLDEFYESLAYHWRHTGNIEKTIEYLLKSGEKAEKAYSNSDAIAYFREVLDLLDNSALSKLHRDWQLAALKGLEQLYSLVGELEEAEVYIRQAISLGHDMELATRDLVRLYGCLLRVLQWQGRYIEEAHVREETTTLSGSIEAESTEAALMNDIIALGYDHKHREKFWEFTQRNARFIQHLPYSQELGPAYLHISEMYADHKSAEKALGWLQALEEKAEQHQDLGVLTSVCYNRGLLLASMGDIHAGVSHDQEYLCLASRTGDVKQGGLRSADYFLLLGDLEKAEEYADRGLRSAEKIHNKRYMSWAYRIIATISLCQGNCERAVEILGKAVELCRETGDSCRVPQKTCALGQAYLAKGDRQKAAMAFQETMALPKPDFPTMFQTGYWMNLNALSGIEEAYDDPDEFQTFCRRFQHEHPEIIRPLFVQWHLEPAEIPRTDIQEAPDSSRNLVNESFNAPLSLDWAWNDPFGDCSFTVQDGLEIHAANARNLWYLNLSAPRILRAASGDFAAQTVCDPASEEKPAIGGILLWKDDKNFLRLDRGTKGKHEISFTGCIDNKDIIIGRGKLRSERIFLRLERVGHRVDALCSIDSSEWFTVGHVDFPVEDPVQVGLHAIGAIDRTIYHGAYPDGTAIRFESFHLWV